MTATSITESAAPAQRRRRIPLLLASVVLMTLAFPPLDAGFLAWIALAPLFYSLLTTRRFLYAILQGYLFGFLHWGWTITWLAATVNNWTGSWLGWVAWCGLVLVKSGWFALFGGLTWWIGRRTQGQARILATAAAWTMVEWFRGQGGLSMPWSLSGYTQYRYLPLIQIADLAGVYAIGFAIALVNAAVAEGVGRCRFPPLLLFSSSAIYLALILAYGAFALRRPYEGPAVRLALMQPNLTTGRTIDRTTEQEYPLWREMTAHVASEKPLLLIWPESIAPYDAINDPATRAAFGKLARQSGAYQLVGTGYEDAQRRPYNSAALFAPDGNLVARYDKQWLVPFGEWIPGRSWLPFGEAFHFFERDTVPGTAENLLTIGPIRLGALICFESVFPVLPRDRVRRGANLLALITNDSWAGESAELAQHMAMTALRAVETRRYVAVSAMTGLTGLIAPTGRMITLPPYRMGTMVVEARLLESRTLYVRRGDWFVGLCAAGLAGLLCRWRRRVGVLSGTAMSAHSRGHKYGAAG